ncbi:MAG: lytic transglycosylase domain-containing protein [Acidimicrobiia bacterium]
MFGVLIDGLAAIALLSADPQCGIAGLPGLARQHYAVIRAESPESYAGRLSEFQRLAESVIGVPLDDGVDWATRTDLPCDSQVRSRDNVAYRMAMVGHSAREIADVLRGHLTLRDLNAAQARLMAGFTRSQVAEFLDARWREPIAAPADLAPIPAPPVSVPTNVEFEMARLAEQYHVPIKLVKAMVAAESGGNARAISSAGAIGLMQLMPATAAALGVDPWHPLENLHGGVRYLAELLAEYDQNPRLALIAYNAGPQHANRVRAGTAVAYRETRKYLDAISASYPLP